MADVSEGCLKVLLSGSYSYMTALRFSGPRCTCEVLE